jgi:hypothetical protein
MSIQDAIQRAHEMLRADATEDEIAEVAAWLWMREATPEERQRAFYAEACEEASTVLIDRAATGEELLDRLEEREQLRAVKG